ncbi:hypothetical protein KM043_006596 [Ampulex compressa]|nr:hypothetical protein KM043_006596 [Ampulex compressa]
MLFRTTRAARKRSEGSGGKGIRNYEERIPTVITSAGLNGGISRYLWHNFVGFTMAYIRGPAERISPGAIRLCPAEPVAQGGGRLAEIIEHLSPAYYIVSGFRVPRGPLGQEVVRWGEYDEGHYAALSQRRGALTCPRRSSSPGKNIGRTDKKEASTNRGYPSRIIIFRYYRAVGIVRKYVIPGIDKDIPGMGSHPARNFGERREAPISSPARGIRGKRGSEGNREIGGIRVSRRLAVLLNEVPAMGSIGGSQDVSTIAWAAVDVAFRLWRP